MSIADKILYDLTATLPKCDACPEAATRAFRRGEGRWCDAHAPEGCPPYPRAEALRRAAAYLKPWEGHAFAADIATLADLAADLLVVHRDLKPQNGERLRALYQELLELVAANRAAWRHAARRGRRNTVTGDIVRLLQADGPMRARDIGRRRGIGRSNARGYIGSLLQRGQVVRSGADEYAAAPGIDPTTPVESGFVRDDGRSPESVVRWLGARPRALLLACSGRTDVSGWHPNTVTALVRLRVARRLAGGFIELTDKGLAAQRAAQAMEKKP